MNDKVREFGDKLKVSGGVGLFIMRDTASVAAELLNPVEADIPRGIS